MFIFVTRMMKRYEDLFVLFGGVVGYFIIIVFVRIKYILDYWKSLHRKSEAKVLSIDFSNAVCSTPAAKSIRLSPSFEFRRLSSVRKTGSQRATSNDSLKVTFSEPRNNKARRELFKPAPANFLMDEEVVLKLPKKVKKVKPRQLRF